MPTTETRQHGTGWPQALESNPGAAGASPVRGPKTSDERLARAASRGDGAAFEALYERHHRALLSFARHMVGSPHDAEDVVQHTFLEANRALRAGDTPKAVRAWLYTVARNRCVSVLRTRRTSQALPDLDLPSTENLAAEVERRDDLRSLLVDLRTLPDDQRSALLLAELGDLTHTEVAKVIGVRPGKVKALVFQAREALMAFSHARAIPCRSIREELAVATGAELRRRHLRHHVAQCEACRDYAARVRAQRSALAAVLPVIPTTALREGVFSAVAGGAAAAGAGGAGAGLGVLAAKSTAAKLLAIAAVGGTAAGGGTAAVTALDAPDRQGATERRIERAPGAPPRTDAPSRAVQPVVGTTFRPDDRGRRVDARAERAKPAEDRSPRRNEAPVANGRARDGGRPGQAIKEARAAPPGHARERPAAAKARSSKPVKPPKPAKVKSFKQPRGKAPKVKAPRPAKETPRPAKETPRAANEPQKQARETPRAANEQSSLPKARRRQAPAPALAPVPRQESPPPDKAPDDAQAGSSGRSQRNAAADAS